MNNLITSTFILLLITMTVWSSSAQISTRQRSSTPPAEEKWSDNIFFGGGIGLGYANGWNINVSPIVGYKLTPKLSAGIGVDYYYASYRYDSRNKDRASVLGPKAFVLFNITPDILIGSEYATYRYKVTQITNGLSRSSTQSQNSWLLGGGYIQRFGANSRAGIRLELYYDVLYDDDPGSFNFRSSAFVPRIGIVYNL